MYGGDARRYPSQYWRTRLRAISIHQADACLEPSGREGKYPMAAADILTYSSRRRRLRPFPKSALGADPRAKAHPVRASADGAVDVRVPGSQEPFVGRTAELDALAEAYAQASDGHTRIVCVEGPAGIGKTALVRAFLTAASSLVISASGDEAEMTLPWGVVSQLARGAPAGQCGPLRQLAELSPGADPLASGGLLLDAVGVLASGRPVVLVVEDLHWIDHPSAQALRFALRRLSGERVLAVVTTRPEGPVQVDEGWRRLFDDRGQRLRLAGLRPPEIARLVSALGGGALSGAAARRLWRHAGGNPLYTRCLVEELDPAVLAAAAGPLPAPRSLATLLVARLAACAPETRDLVSAAAVLGERCPLALAASFSRRAGAGWRAR